MERPIERLILVPDSDVDELVDAVLSWLNGSHQLPLTN